MSVPRAGGGLRADHKEQLAALDDQLRAHEETLAKLQAARSRAENEAAGAVVLEKPAGESSVNGPAQDDTLSPRIAQSKYMQGECPSAHLYPPSRPLTPLLPSLPSCCPSSQASLP